MGYVISFVLGLIVGSFLNVCIYRIPRGISIVFPPSSCPDCGRRIQPLELVPIVGFLMLGGKCKGCGKPISWRYPLVEALTGTLFLSAYLYGGFSWETVKIWFFISLLIPISFIDLEYQIIPNILSVPGMVLGLVLSYLNLPKSLLGMLVGFGIIALIIILSNGGMGWGDSKLLAMVGAFWGWQVALGALFIGSFFGSIVGIYLMIRHRISRKTPIPFGPYLCLGALIGIYVARYFPW